MLLCSCRLSKSLETTLFQCTKGCCRWTEVMRQSCTSQKYNLKIWLLSWHAAYETCSCYSINYVSNTLYEYILFRSSFDCSFRKIYVLQRLRYAILQTNSLIIIITQHNKQRLSACESRTICIIHSNSSALSMTKRKYRKKRNERKGRSGNPKWKKKCFSTFSKTSMNETNRGRMSNNI